VKLVTEVVEITHLEGLWNEIWNIIPETTKDKLVCQRICGIGVKCGSVFEDSTFSTYCVR
jgi:hypothetical protein